MKISISLIEEQTIKSARFSYRLLVLVCFTALIFTNSNQTSSVYQNAVQELNALLSLDFDQLILNAMLKNDEFKKKYTYVNSIFSDYGLILMPHYSFNGNSIFSITTSLPYIEGDALETINQFFIHQKKLSVSFHKVDEHFKDSLRNHLKEMYSDYQKGADKVCSVYKNSEGYSVSCGGRGSGFRLNQSYELGILIIPVDFPLLIIKTPGARILVKENNGEYLFIPNLMQVWDQVRVEPLIEARTILARKDIPQERNLEIFGLSIPQNIISWAIPVLIFALSIYFLIHILHLNRIVNNNSDVINYPWIVIMPGHLANIVSKSTLTVLPLMALGFTLYLTWSSLMLFMKISILAITIGTFTTLIIAIIRISEIKKEKRPNFEAISKFE